MVVLVERSAESVSPVYVEATDLSVDASVAPRRILANQAQDQETDGAHDWGRPDLVHTAVLLASELLGNVLVHTDQAAVLIAAVSGEPGHRTLRVEVSDSGDELPRQRTPGELAASGRGLVLLDILSDQWSVRPEPEGKTVWFELAEESDADADADADADSGTGADS
jgi:anti-sigma regulatory factor (Ser/Thr protein kinase)